MGTLAEIESMPSQNHAVQARKDSMDFRTLVHNLFVGERFNDFRAKVNDIDLTVNALNQGKVSRPQHVMDESLLSIRQEMTKMIVSIDSPMSADPRLADVVSSYASLERSCKSFATHEQRQLAEQSKANKSQALPKEFMKALMPSANGSKQGMVCGLG